MKLSKEYILDCISKYCSLNGLTEYSFEHQVVIPLQANKCFENWTHAAGVTKGVLIFNDLDYVIKIPFYGSDEYVESHYEDTYGNWAYPTDPDDEKYRYVESVEDICPFTGADCEDGWNYCEVETFISERAAEEGMQEHFAVTEFFGLVNNYPIYKQKRCCMFDEMRTSTKMAEYDKRTPSDYETVKKAKSKLDFYDISNDDWVLDFLIYWGEEKLKQLGEFLFKYDIGDLHSGNIGYLNGAPCIVDYSSYHS